MSESRIFQIALSQLDHPGHHLHTVLRLPRAERIKHPPFDAHELFVKNWAAIKTRLEKRSRQGVVVLGFNNRGPASEPLIEGWIEASLDKSRVAVLGRHHSADLLVPSRFESIALRQLVILVRARSHSEVEIRVIDLHTSTGFGDESGRTLQAVVSDGSLFLSIDDLVLAILVTGEEGQLPADGETAYRCVPERIFEDEREGVYQNPHRPRGQGTIGETVVRSMLGARSASAPLCEEGEQPFATLALVGSGMSVERTLGRKALSEGILLGRYSRCDVRTGADSSSLSRVHLLLLQDGDQTLAIDTASSNGTYRAGREIFLTTLEDRDLLDLGGAGGLEVLFFKLR